MFVLDSILLISSVIGAFRSQILAKIYTIAFVTAPEEALKHYFTLAFEAFTASVFFRCRNES